MIFSDDRVSGLVRERFVAAWESVRPVPTVEIDFGNGRKLKRTVNGNIATYVCAPDGRVVDVIPGLSSPESFLESLKYALNLYQASTAQFEETVLAYHRDNLSAPTVFEWVRDDFAKCMVERLMRMSLDLRQELLERKKFSLRIVSHYSSGPASGPLGFVPGRALTPEESAILAADTEINRKERLPIIHKILSEKVVRPAEITRRIYKEALHCDLEDPYLGLISGAFGGGAYENR